MKRFILMSCLLAVSLFFVSLHSVEAAGTIQFVGPQTFPQARVGHFYSTTIQYIYSGTNYTSVSLIGDNTDIQKLKGLKFSPVQYGTNGLDSITLSGMPTISGNYSLSLLITDNNGAILSQPFTLNVAQSDEDMGFSKISLPDTYAGARYEGTVIITYSSYKPLVEISGWPGFTQIMSSPVPAGTDTGGGTITVLFTSPGLRADHYEFAVTLSVFDKKVSRTFAINVAGLGNSTPAPTVAPGHSTVTPRPSITPKQTPAPTIKPAHTPTPSVGSVVSPIPHSEISKISWHKRFLQFLKFW